MKNLFFIIGLVLCTYHSILANVYSGIGSNEKGEVAKVRDNSHYLHPLNPPPDSFYVFKVKSLVVISLKYELPYF